MSVSTFSYRVIAFPFFSRYNELSNSGVQQKT